AGAVRLPVRFGFTGMKPSSVYSQNTETGETPGRSVLVSAAGGEKGRSGDGAGVCSSAGRSPVRGDDGACSGAGGATASGAGAGAALAETRSSEDDGRGRDAAGLTEKEGAVLLFRIPRRK